MTLHPKDQDWADPGFNKPENKILGKPTKDVIVHYHRLKRYVHIQASGLRVDISKDDFNDLLPELQIYNRTADGDYYQFKQEQD